MLPQQHMLQKGTVVTTHDTGKGAATATPFPNINYSTETAQPLLFFLYYAYQ